ncbi:hypothetical protein M1116_01045 [Patescibacteria group bacterium]|nr:hypothetical protein [Patescibacteria group bacterium]
MSPVQLATLEETIRNHIQHYTELLAPGNPVNIADFIPTYKLMQPSMHHHLGDNWIDVSTLNYALSRLPSELRETQSVIMVKDPRQLPGVITTSHVWKKVTAVNRRRLSFYNPLSRTLVFVITSDSDIDDIVNALVAIEIESEKIHQALRHQRKQFDDHELINLFGITVVELESLKMLLGHDWKSALATWGARSGTTLQLLKSNSSYDTAFEDWIDQLRKESLFIDLFDTPVYFVSSNTHSLTNLITGYVWQIEAKLFTFIESTYPSIYEQWQLIKTNNDPTRVYDFVYYLSKIYFEHHPEEVQERNRLEVSKGIRRIVSTGPFESVTQIIPLNSFQHFEYPDPQLASLPFNSIKDNSAIIINIEYPLGQAAYYLMETFLKHFKNVKGIYIIGKAAILNGNIGDIQIPKTVLDEKTASTFNFDNCFNQSNVLASNVHTHDSLKALSLFGTFLENRRQMEGYLADGYNVIEMESGSYLASIYHYLHPETAVENGNFDIRSTPFDIGIINYASDNPLVQTLGDTPLITRGIEPTYAATSAVIKRIIELESKT